MRSLKSYAVIVFLVLGCMFFSSQAFAQEKIGVLYIVHGGFEQYSSQNLFDSSIHIFAVRPDHPVHKWFLFNSAGWEGILAAGNAPKEIGKYSFEYERLGGDDPFPAIINSQVAQLTQELQQRTPNGTQFVVEQSGWISPDNIEQFPYPRFLYTAPDYIAPFSFAGIDFLLEEDISGLTYCGEEEADGPWVGCDPERYNVDGPAERFIAQGVDRIIVVDQTMGGIRFFKTHDTLTLFKKALVENGGAAIPVDWINDPNDLMDTSYPTAPVGNWGIWTPDRGTPTAEPSVPLADNPNPIIESMTVAELLAEGTEASFNPAVEDAHTGVLVLNHAIGDYRQYYDPKIDDTIKVNTDIKNMLLARHPNMDPDNIVGAYMGIKEDGAAEGCTEDDCTERTRNMRGENLGHAWLYESTSVPGEYAGPGLLPGDEWGYKYWNALEYLKNRGVEHIVICFPQIVADSVLNMVEIPNQIAKEIGYKNWLNWVDSTSSTPSNPDYVSYPGIGHPFADYWGIWVDTECDNANGSGGTVDCCFEMGGCGNDSERPYPPPRQTTDARDDLDPSLAYDVSEFGHLGYNSVTGSPNPNSPVQSQYTGTWAMYQTPNDDSRVTNMLANHVLLSAGAPSVYGTISGAVQEGVTVNIARVSCGSEILIDTTVTNSEGYYSFDSLESGYKYLISASKTGYSFVPFMAEVRIPQAVIQPYNFTATAK